MNRKYACTAGWMVRGRKAAERYRRLLTPAMKKAADGTGNREMLELDGIILCHNYKKGLLRWLLYNRERRPLCR